MDLSFGRKGTYRHARAVWFRIDLKDAARQNSQLAALPQVSDLRFDLRRHAVAVDIPPRACVFQEPPAGLTRHGAPDRLHVWAQTINNASPIAAASHFVARPRAKPVQETSERRCRRQFCFRDRRDIDAAMGLREKAAPSRHAGSEALRSRRRWGTARELSAPSDRRGRHCHLRRGYDPGPHHDRAWLVDRRQYLVDGKRASGSRITQAKTRANAPIEEDGA